MHTTGLLFGFGTAFASIPLDLFNNSTLWCWIAQLPFNCKDSFSLMENEETTCVRGDNAYIYRLAFFYIPLWMSMIVVLAVNVWIYRTVRIREQKAEQLHAIHHAKHGRTSFAPNIQNSPRHKSSLSFTCGQNPANIFTIFRSSTSPSNNEAKNTREKVRSTGSSGPVLLRTSGENELENLEQLKHSSVRLSARDRNPDEIEEKNTHHSHTVNDYKDDIGDSLCAPNLTIDKYDSLQPSSNDRDEENRRIPAMVLPEKFARRLSQWSYQQNERRQRQSKTEKNDVDSTNSADVRFVLATIEDYPSAAKQYAATYHIGARLVLYQSIAYVLGFWMIWLFPTINRQVQYYGNENRLWLLILQGFFEPLQGVFNVLVYRFAFFLRLKQLHPQFTTRKLLGSTFRWTFLGTVNKFDDDGNIDMANDQKGTTTSNDAINIFSESIKGCNVWDNDSQLMNPSHDIRSFLEKPEVRKSISSLMGDLMTEYADDPSLLNENFVEFGNTHLFSSPPSPLFIQTAFPTITTRQSFSRHSSDRPNVAPMTDTPIVELSGRQLPNRKIKGLKLRV